MQTYEFLAMIVFLVMYLGSAVRAIIAPGAYREAEIAFYKSGKPGIFEQLSFILTSLALAFLVLHFVFETPRLGQIVLYAMVILFELILPFHFMPFYRDRMVRTLQNKSDADYRSSGYRRLVIGAVIVLLPLIYP